VIEKITHAIMPLAVVAAATVLLALGKIDSTTAVALIGTAGGYGAIAVHAAK
jgi:proteasome assembly chaperone (PAC2) family protein